MRSVVFSLVTVLMATMLCSSSCKKKEEKAFYYECKVNGNYFTYGGGPNDMQCYTQGDSDLIVGGSLNNESVVFTRHDLTGIKIGNYDIKTPGYPTGAFYSNQPYVDNIYRTDSNHTGKLFISELDAINKIIAGTFYFKAYCKKYDSAVNITEGRFRLKYLKY